jgi:hypothetical protein
MDGNHFAPRTRIAGMQAHTVATAISAIDQIIGIALSSFYGQLGTEATTRLHLQV